VDREAPRASVRAATNTVDRELSTLTGLRVRDLVTDEEYLARRNDLSMRRLTLVQSLDRLQESVEWIEPLELFVSFCNRATKCFLRGDLIQKRLILETVGSNLFLKDGKVSIRARKPFIQMGHNTPNFELCTTVHDVRTFLQTQDEGFAKVLQNIKTILATDDARRAAA